MSHDFSIFLSAVLILFSRHGRAGPAESILQAYGNAASANDRAFKEFSKKRGRQLYVREGIFKDSKVSCSTCHTDNPRQMGHTRANKDIEPMAVSVNPKRLSDPAKVEKWFARNCDDVLKRPCTAMEKGDFMTYLLNVK